MLRLLLFLAATGTAAIGAAWLAGHPGSVTILWHGWRIDTSLAFLAACLTALAVVLLLTLVLLKALLRGPSVLLRRTGIRRQLLGYHAATEGLAALSLANPSAAKPFARKAEKYLGHEPLALLLSAQLARMEGNEDDTRRRLEAMLEHKETAYLAARSLCEQALHAGQAQRALDYALRAEKLHPHDAWVSRELVDIYLRLDRWQEAMQRIKSLSRHISRNEAKRLRGLVFLQRAQKNLAEGEVQTAITFGRLAYRDLKRFPPAAAVLAQALAKAGEREDALKIITRAWRHHPHPQLSTLALELLEPLPKPQRLKRVEKLAAQTPAHRESRFMRAAAAARAGEWSAARKQASALLEEQETARACAMMAEVEEGEHGDFEAGVKWRQRRAGAAFDPAWLCGHCAHMAEQWSLRCPSCDAFDAMTWTQPQLRFLPAEAGSAA